jgi:hypothetical protein
LQELTRSVESCQNEVSWETKQKSHILAKSFFLAQSI